jgi:hypothetical protein
MADIDIAWQDLELARREIELDKKKRGERFNPELTYSDVIIKAWINDWRKSAGIKETNTLHTCDKDCFEKHTDLIFDGINLYGCRMSGLLHACNTTAATHALISSEHISTICRYFFTNGDGLKVCCISGFVTGLSVFGQRESRVTKSKDDWNTSSAYVIEDSFELNQVLQNNSKKLDVIYGPERKKNKRHRNNMNYDAQGEKEYGQIATCEGVISDLLFNRTTRQRIDNCHTADMMRKTKQEIKKYLKEKESLNEYPNANAISRIYECHMNYKTRLLLLKTDGRIIKYYRDIIMKIWKLVHGEIYYNNHGDKSRYEKFQFRQIVIALLYMLPEGIGIILNEPSSSCEAPIGSIRESIDSIRGDDSSSNITVQTIENSENMINMITFDDDDDLSGEDSDDMFIGRKKEHLERIQIIDRDEFLMVNLPKESDLKNISCSVASKKNYTKKDITKGTLWIKQEFGKIKDSKLLETIRDQLSAHVKAHKYLFEQM